MGHREEDSLPGKKLILRVVIGAAAGLVVALAAAAVLSVAVAGGRIPADRSLAVAMVCVLIGTFAGSFFTVRKHKGKRWLLGLAVGFGVFGMLFVFGLVAALPQSGVPQMLITTLLAGFLGGLPAGKRRKHKR